jgi:hypothetical protein
MLGEAAFSTFPSTIDADPTNPRSRNSMVPMFVEASAFVVVQLELRRAV